MFILRRKLLLSLVALAVLTASATLAFGMQGHLQQGHAASQAVTASDFYPPAGNDPWGTAFDSSGNVWLAMPGCDPNPQCSNSTPPGKIVVFNPATNRWIHTYNLPVGYAQPLFLAFDRQGRLWFPMPMNNSLGMLNPATATFQRWTVPTPGSGPWGVAVDGNGLIWFTEHYGYKIGNFNPATQTFTEIPTPSTASLPYGITIDKANNVWFTENNSSVALIGEYTAQGHLLEYKIRNGSTSGLTPHLITIDHNGNVWWSEGWVAMIGVLRVAQARAGTNNGVTEYKYTLSCTNCGSHTSGISADGYGNIWFDDSLQSVFGSFPASGTGSFSMYNTPTSNAHPHDGLNVDAKNTIWFNEEFANKLAQVKQVGAGNPSPIASASPSPSVTVASSTPTTTATASPTVGTGTVIAQDTFQRANQSLWGRSSDGHTWGGDANTNSIFSISNNTGRVASGGNNYNAILGASSTNEEALFTGSISSFTNTNIGAVVRWTDGNNWYKAYIDGTNLVVQEKVNGSVTTLKSVPFAAKAGTLYAIRFNVTGTTLSAKAWAATSSEPTGWMATATDTSLASGYCGLRLLVQNGATITITSFVATALP